MILRETDQSILDMLQNVSRNIIKMMIVNARNNH